MTGRGRFIPPEYRPDLPWYVYLVFAAIVSVPVLIALLLQVTG